MKYEIVNRKINKFNLKVLPVLRVGWVPAFYWGGQNWVWDTGLHAVLQKTRGKRHSHYHTLVCQFHKCSSWYDALYKGSHDHDKDDDGLFRDHFYYTAPTHQSSKGHCDAPKDNSSPTQDHQNLASAPKKKNHPICMPKGTKGMPWAEIKLSSATMWSLRIHQQSKIENGVLPELEKGIVLC